MYGKQSPPRIDTPAQHQSEVDLNLTAKLYSSLRMLRTILVKEAGEGLMAYHIFGYASMEIGCWKPLNLPLRNTTRQTKIAAVAMTVPIPKTEEEMQMGLQSPNANVEEEDDFTKSTGRSKKGSEDAEQSY